MGNEQIKQELRKCRDLDFNNKELDPYLAKLWTFEDQETFTYKSLFPELGDIQDYDCKK